MELEFFAENKFYFLVAHVASVVVGMGSALISDILFSFYSKDRKLSRREVKVLDTLSKIVWTSLIIIALTGIGIFLSDPARYLASAKFLAKMSVTAVLIINGYILLKLVQPHLKNPNFLTSGRERQTRKIAFSCGAVSLVSWVSSFVLANLDSLPFNYPATMSFYVLVVVGGIIASLGVESWSFERRSRK